MDEPSQPRDPAQQPQLGYELRDANVRAVALFGLVLVIVLAGALLLMQGMFDHFAARPLRSDVLPVAREAMRRLPPEPRLQANPARALQEIRTTEDRVLHSYGWVDREAGIVRLPIDRAMELLAERGLPARSEAPDAQSGRP